MSSGHTDDNVSILREKRAFTINIEEKSQLWKIIPYFVDWAEKSEN